MSAFALNTSTKEQQLELGKLNFDSMTDINMQFVQLTNIFSNAVNHHAPLKFVTRRER